MRLLFFPMSERKRNKYFVKENLLSYIKSRCFIKYLLLNITERNFDFFLKISLDRL